MLAVDIDVLLRSISCPLQSLFSQAVPREDDVQRLERKVLKVISWYYFRLMDGEVIGSRKLLDRWNDEWFSGKQPVEIFFSDISKDTQLGLRGVRWLENFLNHIQSSPGRPLAINNPFEVEVRGHRLKGNIPLVREVSEEGRRIVEIVDYRGMGVPRDRWDVDTDLRLAILSLAFRQLFGAREQRTRLVTLSTGGEHFYYYKAQDRHRTLAILRQVLPLTNPENAWPRHGPHCRACEYQKECLDWKG